jgi:hypothetical protein
VTLARLKEKMLYQLQGFVPESKREEITTTTIHNTVLKSDSKAKLYKDFVRMSALLEDTKLKRWPSKWLTMNIDDLAPQLLP